MERLISVLGLFVFVGISYALSVNRRAIRWSPVLWGIALQLIFGVLILKTAPGFAVFKFLGDVVSRFLDFSDAGAKFVFGDNFGEHFIAFKVLQRRSRKPTASSRGMNMCTYPAGWLRRIRCSQGLF